METGDAAECTNRASASCAKRTCDRPAGGPVQGACSVVASDEAVGGRPYRQLLDLLSQIEEVDSVEAASLGPEGQRSREPSVVAYTGACPPQDQCPHPTTIRPLRTVSHGRS